MCSTITTTWKPLSLTSETNDYGIILLNQPIRINLGSFQKLWNQAKFRISVDGGTNHLYQSFVETNKVEFQIHQPDIITGDFDSILPNVKAHFQCLGSKIVETLDQNYTDFTKALMELRRGIDAGEYPCSIKRVLVINESSGRLDQVFANVNTLFQSIELGLGFEVYLLSQDSLSWLLSAKTHKIELDQNYAISHSYCGLIPLNGKTLIKTSGLKWNLDQSTECYFGGMISTSNEVIGEIVEIETNGDILWTMTPPKSILG